MDSPSLAAAMFVFAFLLVSAVIAWPLLKRLWAPKVGSVTSPAKIVGTPSKPRARLIPKATATTPTTPSAIKPPRAPGAPKVHLSAVQVAPAICTLCATVGCKKHE